MCIYIYMIGKMDLILKMEMGRFGQVFLVAVAVVVVVVVVIIVHEFVFLKDFWGFILISAKYKTHLTPVIDRMFPGCLFCGRTGAWR